MANVPAAGTTPAGSAPAEVRLRPPRHRVDPRALRWWTVQALVSTAFPLAILVVLAILVDGGRSGLLVAAVAVLVAGGAYALIMPRWRFRVHRWETTDTAVYTSSGWLWQEARIAPLSRIQTVDTVRGPLQQLFGLSGVTVTTASAAGAIRIDGLDHQLAADLVEQLTESTQATPGDAT